MAPAGCIGLGGEGGKFGRNDGGGGGILTAGAPLVGGTGGGGRALERIGGGGGARLAGGPGGAAGACGGTPRGVLPSGLDGDWLSLESTRFCGANGSALAE